MAESPRSYRRGDRGAAVAEIRHKLAVLGLLPPGDALTDPNEALFDETADVAVRTFQQQRGISADGIVGEQTWRTLEEARWRLGDRILSYRVTALQAGDDVAALQQRLSDMGFNAGRVDGIFDRDTDSALKEFQRNVGLRADGTCGPATFQALDRLNRTIVGGRPVDLRDEEAMAQQSRALSGKVVILDPGHGGADRGEVANGQDEASIVEDLVARVEGRLTATGVFAFLTRSPEGSFAEAERAAFANAAEADLCISLHVDGSANPLANGIATFYYGNDRYGHSSATGSRFASLVQREIVARTDLTDCRTHPKTWDILRRTRMPTVRLELGYLTNPGDAARLAEPEFRDTVAESIVVAIQRLFLPPEDDAPTGTLRLGELLRAELQQSTTGR